MKTTIFYALALLLMANYPAGSKAATGDFRTKASGNWNSLSTWEYYNGSAWVGATWTPTYLDADINILAGHSVAMTSSVTVDQVNVKGTLTINAGVTMTINSGTGTDVYVDNLSSAYAYLHVYGMVVNKDVLSKSDGAIFFYNNSTYRHAQNGGTIEDMIWSTNSNCEITGLTDDTGGPGNLDQTFGNFIWNCTGQTVLVNLSTIPYVAGNFSMESTGTGTLSLSDNVSENMTVAGNYSQTGGNFYPSTGSGNNIIYIGGNFYMDGGKLSGPASGSGSTTLVFNKNGTQTYTYSASQGSVANKLNFQINANSVLDVGQSIVGDPLYTTGSFTLASGAGLKTAHGAGISSTGASGSVQVTGTRTFDPAAHYTYYGSGSQSSGTGLPATVSASGTITIGSSSDYTTLNFSSLRTINGTLVIINGTVGNSNLALGGSGILEYRGTSPQTTGNYDFPSGSVPNLKINNPTGVTLNSSKTVTTNLYLSLGELMIGSGNTLTLNGTISRTSGSLNGHANHTSGITFAGSGNTSLPGLVNGLNNLILNRAGATITLTGGLTVYGTMTMSAGSLLTGGGALAYGPAGTLRYTGAYTTSNHEFPAAFGPYDLDIGNNVSLHASRTLNGNLALNSGSFSIGPNTLTMNGRIIKTGGSLIGGPATVILFGENPSPSDLPAVQLLDLTIERAAGVTMTGNVIIEGTLNLKNGAFQVQNSTLTLNGPPIAGDPLNLTTNFTSGLDFGGSYSGVMIPSGVNQLAFLTIRNTKGVTLNSNMEIINGLQVESLFRMNDLEITGMAFFKLQPWAKLVTGHPEGVSGNIKVSGPLMVDSETDYEFTGENDQVTGFLPAIIPQTVRNVLINKESPWKTVFDDDITLTGSLDVMHPETFEVGTDKIVTVMGNLTVFQ